MSDEVLDQLDLAILRIKDAYWHVDRAMTGAGARGQTMLALSLLWRSQYMAAKTVLDDMRSCRALQIERAAARARARADEGEGEGGEAAGDGEAQGATEG